MITAFQKTGVILGLVCAIVAQPSAFAKISVDAAFNGTLIITGPTGDIKVLQEGEAIPDIENGSTIEIFDGTLTISNDPGDNVSVSCMNSGIVIGGGGSAAVVCGPDSGTLRVITNPVSFENSASDVKLEEGKIYPIPVGTKKTAPPTATVDNPDGTPLAGDPPVDSRSIQSSPAL